ncbi:hypothetical protein AGMMS50239_01410 [Bacteroidia bacterium]|nr:hypothetical protein AGMMS50239_01410 [Bacteroidia bacterium]
MGGRKQQTPKLANAERCLPKGDFGGAQPMTFLLSKSPLEGVGGIFHDKNNFSGHK